MKRQCEDYRLVASRPIIWWFSPRRVPPRAACSRSLVPRLTKGCFFTRKCQHDTPGAGLIERNERSSASREHGNTHSVERRPTIRDPFSHCSLYAARFPADSSGKAWPLLIKTGDCETRQPVTASRPNRSRTDPAARLLFHPGKRQVFPRRRLTFSSLTYSRLDSVEEVHTYVYTCWFRKRAVHFHSIRFYVLWGLSSIDSTLE